MTNNIKVQLKKFKPNAVVPEYKTEGAAAFDLAACIPEGEVFYVRPQETRKVPTGVGIFLQDQKFGLFVWERSGLSSTGIARRGGLIDADYQGEIMVTLTNHTSEYLYVKTGDRVGQAVIQEVYRASFEVVEEFPIVTERGENGFGSTDKQ